MLEGSSSEEVGASFEGGLLRGEEILMHGTKDSDDTIEGADVGVATRLGEAGAITVSEGSIVGEELHGDVSEEVFEDVDCVSELMDWLGEEGVAERVGEGGAGPGLLVEDDSDIRERLGEEGAGFSEMLKEGSTLWQAGSSSSSLVSMSGDGSFSFSASP